MIAANFENLLFLLLVAVAVLFQLLAKAAGKMGKDQTRRTATPVPRTTPPISRAPRESAEGQIRKLLEALGQPPTSKPPPPIVPRADIPPRPLAPVQPPLSPLSQLRREKARKRDVTPKEIRPPRTVRGAEEVPPPKIATTAAFEVHEGPLPIESRPVIKAPAEAYAAETRRVAKTQDSRTDIATLLASKSSLRAAIILREILGAPRGLRA
jgi:hypothetical protein